MREKHINPFAKLIPEMDLRKFARDSDRCSTTIDILPDWDSQNRIRWIRAGAVIVRERNASNASHELVCRVADGATDFEHDSAILFNLPLSGWTYKGIIFQHTVSFEAWIAPRLDVQEEGRRGSGGGADNFHVPNADYNPFKHPEAGKCKECKGKEAHMFVPYLPPDNPKLYNIVKGMKVEVSIGTVRSDDEEEE